jgi:hypothetical protein
VLNDKPSVTLVSLKRQTHPIYYIFNATHYLKDNIFASLLHHEAKSSISCVSRCAGAMLRQHKQEKKSVIKIHVEWMQVGLSRGKNKEASFFWPIRPRLIAHEVI